MRSPPNFRLFTGFLPPGTNQLLTNKPITYSQLRTKDFGLKTPYSQFLPPGTNKLLTNELITDSRLRTKDFGLPTKNSNYPWLANK